MSAAPDRERRGLGVQALLFLVFAGVVFAFVARVGDPTHPFLDTDLWWHLANGRYILAHGIPSQDVYSHTAVGHVWVVHEWLSDVAFYILYQLGGLRILVLVTAAAVTAAMILVYRSLRRGGLGNGTAVLLAMVLFIAAVPSFGARPQVINFLLTAVLIAILLDHRRNPTAGIWWLLPGFVVWANLHSGYLVGVGLLAVFTLGEALQAALPRMAALRQDGIAPLSRGDLRRLWALVPLGFVAGILTPATYRTLFFALGTLSSSNIQSFITEWFSPDFHQVQGKALLLCILVLVGGLLATRRAAGTAASDPTFVLLGLSTLALALTSQRHVPIFAAAAAPLLGGAASGLLAAIGIGPRRLRRPTPGMVRANVGILLILASLGLFYVATNLRTSVIDGVVSAVEPESATNWLLANHPPREMFNNYSFGGWLVWKAYPDYPVFIDGRIEVYGDQVFGDYLQVEGLSDNWQQVLDRHHVRTLVITPGDRLTLVLPRNGWKLVHSDPVALVYSRG